MPRNPAASDVVEGIMNPDPAHYAGRGNMLIDLDTYKLERVWEVVADKAGHEAAGAFVKMVHALAGTGDMSATTFLSALSDLAHSGWRFTGLSTSGRTAITSAIELSEYPNKVKSALQTVASLGPSRSAVTAERIAGEFLERHPVPKPPRTGAWGPQGQPVPDIWRK